MSKRQHTLEEFAALVRAHRRQTGWSQGVLAKKAGLSDHSRIARIENAQTAPLNVVQALIDALDQRLHFSSRQLGELAGTYVIPPRLRVGRNEASVVGVIVPSIDGHSFHSRVVGALERYARQHGYTIALCQHQEDIDREIRALRVFDNVSELVGLILAPASGISQSAQQYGSQIVSNLLAGFAGRGVPAVFIDRRIATTEVIPFVGLDNHAAAGMAIDKLVELGHRRIGAIFALRQTTTQQERYQGYREALDRHNLQYDERLVKFGEEVDEAHRDRHRERYGIRLGRWNTEQLLNNLSDDLWPTALFCGTYYTALEAVRAIRSTGRKGRPLVIPDDLSVIGFDEIGDFEMLEKPLAHINYSSDELAQRAMEVLHRMIDNPGELPSPVPLIEPRLIEGQSLGRPRLT